MKRYFFILLLTFITPLLWRGAGGEVFGQLLDSAAFFSAPIYDDLNEALKTPNSVYRLSLKGKKLKVFPLEILKFTNLQELNLSKNKLDSIPNEIGELKNLQILDVSSNKLEYFPDSIGKLKNLKKIAAGKNEIIAIPKQIGELQNLEILDLWSNQINIFPDELNKLKKLRWMDLRVIEIEDIKQRHIQEILPNVIIHFSPSCHCVSG
jgi:Leucine-rich repeat (LRR) protein